MTREEAIWWVNHLFEIRKEEYFNKGMMKDAKEVEEAQAMVLEALSADAVHKPDYSYEADMVRRLKEALSEKPSGDLISRQDAIDAITTDGTRMERFGLTRITIVEAKQKAVDLLESLPSADITDTEECQKCQETTERVLLNARKPNRGELKFTLSDGTEIPIDEESYEIGYTHGQMADRPTGWIPVSERLPKEKQEVYVTVYFIEGDTGRAYGYIDGFGKWHLYSAVEGTLISGYEVTAWMPLPEPYKGGDDE